MITGNDGSGYRVDGNKLAFEGIFHTRLIQGKFDGRLDGKRVLFSFDASDELEPVHGAGRMSLLFGRMELRLTFFLRNEFGLICKGS